MFMVGESLARGKYPLARITETFPDDKGDVRSVKLKDANGEKTRPVVKLVPLERLDDDMVAVPVAAEVEQPPSAENL